MYILVTHVSDFEFDSTSHKASVLNIVIVLGQTMKSKFFALGKDKTGNKFNYFVH